MPVPTKEGTVIPHHPSTTMDHLRERAAQSVRIRTTRQATQMINMYRLMIYDLEANCTDNCATVPMPVQ